jgi:hypothetical protein
VLARGLLIVERLALLVIKLLTQRELLAHVKTEEPP